LFGLFWLWCILLNIFALSYLVIWLAFDFYFFRFFFLFYFFAIVIIFSKETKKAPTIRFFNFWLGLFLNCFFLFGFFFCYLFFLF
jgi:hypothetical protein